MLRSCVPVSILCLFAFACCPSGVWLDDFGNQYQIVTAPSLDPMSTPRVTGGSMDTRGWGCGIWDVRPLDPAQYPDETYKPGYQLAFVAVNPHPSPYDSCCYKFRFDGNETSPGCVAVEGQYESRDGKCNQSGPLVLEPYRSNPGIHPFDHCP